MTELAEYDNVGKGSCRDEAGKYPRNYGKHYAFSTISGCRDVCTNLSAACVGYDVVVSGVYAGLCYLFGSALPDEGTGAAAPGKPLGGYVFNAGDGGRDTLTRGSGDPVRECYTKLPGASDTHPHPCPAPPLPSSH